MNLGEFVEEVRFHLNIPEYDPQVDSDLIKKKINFALKWLYSELRGRDKYTVFNKRTIDITDSDIAEVAIPNRTLKFQMPDSCVQVKGIMHYTSPDSSIGYPVAMVGFGIWQRLLSGESVRHLTGKAWAAMPIQNFKESMKEGITEVHITPIPYYGRLEIYYKVRPLVLTADSDEAVGIDDYESLIPLRAALAIVPNLNDIERAQTITALFTSEYNTLLGEPSGSLPINNLR